MNNTLSTFNRTIRFTTGLVIIGAVLSMSQLPAWLSLLAIYPVFTAIVKWDPFHALPLLLKDFFTSSPVMPNHSHNVSA